MNLKSLLQHLLPAPLVRSLRLARARRRAEQFLMSSARASASLGKIDPEWRQRIDDVLASPDNKQIPRCPDAGTLEGYAVTMHNGVRVCANGYYGEGILNMLVENRGVHEPQEERVFEEVIRLLPEDCTMLELGSYWAFYSLSLLQQRPNARCFMVEPEFANLVSGQLNFVLNKRSGHFIHAAVGAKPSKEPKVITVDTFCRQHGIEHLDILHSDIQGHELEMLDGARHMLSEGRVAYVFISTHSNDLHTECLRRLTSVGYTIMANADLDRTYSADGIIFAKHHAITNPLSIGMSLKSG